MEYPRCALWLSMGLGKTSTVLTAIKELQRQFEVGRVLVVAPKRVARKVWSDETKKWAHLADMRTSIMVGKPDQRMRAKAENAEVWTVNFSNLEWLTDQYRRKGQSSIRKGNPWPWDMVVIDEASGFKNRETNRWKAFYRVFRHTQRIVELTGSPAPNGLIDVWAPMFFLDDGLRLGRSLGAYRERWFEKPQYSWRYQALSHAERQIHGRVKDLVLSMRAEDYLDLPPVMYNPIYVDLTRSEQKTYDQMAKKHWATICGRDITAFNAGVAFGKCLQLANGACYFDDEKNFETFHEHKIEVLRELLITSRDEGKPVMMFYSYFHDLVRLKKLMKTQEFKYLEFRILDTEQDEDDWNDGKLDVLAMHPASGGHGLNLQDGGETIIWIGPNPSLELTNQANARIAGGLRRVGKNVVVHTIYTENTVDEIARDLLTEKGDTEDRLMYAMKKTFV